jgi:zinc transporter ZupT
MVGIVLGYMIGAVGTFIIHNTILTYVMAGAAALFMIYTIISFVKTRKAGNSEYGYVKVIGYEAAITVMLALMSYSFSLQ